ncbi:MAG: dehypoxanthine futalosine cyclase [Nitrospinaceae bacterium]|nr:dehypoxanthine futalosine cyclase [Nitrospinaceae bacterium]NIR55495.1 dehypoxanthine futalosine cyclase [Nitrospinaceae bacterium]NIS85927.1 dehypoxanthine futalosine cyclase [Nitrospinaceae bacterium]NIT82775.1 dehypoxanthine futalosine cyclase [Nitrospinaceae bacterium]NIU44979.1 dehypoxanthine futalosine cyclase [Nitrospinaceae bacterium]
MIEEILKKALDGRRINGDEARALFDTTDMTLLGNAATRLSRRRRQTDDNVVTYIIDRNINYTNVCVTDCTFCAFYRHENHADAYVLPFETIAQKIEEMIAVGGRQILMQGGHHKDLRIDYFEDLFRRIKQRYEVHLHALSPPEIVHITKISKIPLQETLERLIAAGLDSIPGGGAEILVDRVRKIISPNKCSADQWLEVMDQAHRLGLKTTATMMYGHVETPEERVQHLLRLRDQQDKTGGFTAFIPWPFQPGETELASRIQGQPNTGMDYLRTLAISRIVLDNIDNIQSSWVTQGPKIGQMALYYGANDMGSVLMEENVVSAAGTVYYMDEKEICRLISDSGHTPQMRNMRYEWV